MLRFGDQGLAGRGGRYRSGSCDHCESDGPLDVVELVVQGSGPDTQVGGGRATPVCGTLNRMRVLSGEPPHHL